MMPPLLAWTLFVAAIVGNTALWIGVLNRAHALGIWRLLIHACSAASLLGLLGGPLLLAYAALSWSPNFCGAWLAALLGEAVRAPDTLPGLLATLYGALSLVVAGATAGWWLFSQFLRCAPAQLLSHHTMRLLLAQHLPIATRARGLGRLAAALPGNEIFCLDITQKHLALPGLPPSLDGFSIAHLSDLHMSGRLGVEYFQEVIEHVNALQPDLVAVTGDIIDAAECLDWIPDTLGRLAAPQGVCYILGNHDCWVDTAALRRTLDEAGLEDLGGRTRLLEISGITVQLAGNELPWIGPAADVDLVDVAASTAGPDLRILLSHSPDQIRWAQRRGFDLMLAGHTHGGQVRLPIVGALLSPSIFGTKYASGIFYEAPTLLHVSRGVSALTPLRWNCRPEVSLLRLSCGLASNPSSAASPAGQIISAGG